MSVNVQMVPNFIDKFKNDERPWLILGKGPTLDELPKHDVSGYLTVSLNHVVRHTPVDIAHVIDFDVYEQCADAIYSNAKFLVMPYYPHFGFRPSPLPHKSLWALANALPSLNRLYQEGRLLAYNLSTSPLKVGSTPSALARKYSAEAVVSLARLCGTKTVRTLGVDGGHAQSKTFSDLPNHNASRGYDAQWITIREHMRAGIDYAPLYSESPIRVFVGCGPRQLVPALVLKHTILKHATQSVEVTPMCDWHHPMPRSRKLWPRTPFSFQRFMIPKHCKHTGHAIYLDSDMIVFQDIADFWNRAPKDYQVVSARSSDNDHHRAQFSSILLNCRMLDWDIEQIIGRLNANHLTYEDLVFNMNEAKSIYPSFDPEWNSLESYTEGKTKLLHYTEMYRQPWWRKFDHPLAYLWFDALRSACTSGDLDPSMVQSHVKKGYLLPECLKHLGSTQSSAISMAS